MISKYYLVTGASSGIGYSAVRIMATEEPHSVFIIPIRSEVRGIEIEDSLRRESRNMNIFFLLADLSSFAEVKKLADAVTSKYPRLDVLVNNAGVYMEKKTITADNLEETYQVNYFTPFLLSYLLIERLGQSEDGRIVNVSSVGHFMARKFTPQQLLSTKDFQGFKNYCVSKLALILFTHQLAKVLKSKNITVNALHPGGVNTKIARNNSFFNILMQWFGISADKGASPIVYLSQSKEAKAYTGQYFDQLKRTPSPTSQLGQDEPLAENLFKFTLGYFKLMPII